MLPSKRKMGQFEATGAKITLWYPYKGWPLRYLADWWEPYHGHPGVAGLQDIEAFAFLSFLARRLQELGSVLGKLSFQRSQVIFRGWKLKQFRFRFCKGHPFAHTEGWNGIHFNWDFTRILYTGKWIRTQGLPTHIFLLKHYLPRSFSPYW